MANNMQSIKRCIRSAESTKKITKAVQLVTTSGLQKIREQLEELRPYYSMVQETVAEILANNKNLIDNPYLKENTQKRTVYIAMASSLRLCGEYSANVLKAIADEIDDNDLVYMIDSKGVAYLTHR